MRRRLVGIWFAVAFTDKTKKQSRKDKGIAMKQFTKNMVVLLIGVLAFGAAALAGPNERAVRNHIVDLSMKNFRQSLKSDIPGVVEGTISDVIVFKKLYPDLDFDGIKDRLNEVAETSKVPVISYEAHLATIYLTHPAQFEIVPNENPERQDDVFRQIADQLQKQLIGVNAGNTALSSN
jgi:hypothetical protein